MTMRSVILTPATAAWLFLVGATAASWLLGTDHGLSSHYHDAAAAIILVLAVIKVRIVGTYFMELRAAPVLLRSIFDTYCAVVLLLLFVGMFALG
jgi:hypothetical protein